jgi:PKD repeat protein
LFISGVLVLLVSIGLAHAKGADPEMATKVAETQVRLISQRLAKTNYLSAPYTLSTNNLKHLYSEDEKLLAYVFELEPRGFVVVTTNTNLVPVITYSEHGSFPWDESPLNLLLHMLREDLRMRMAARDMLEQEQIARYHALWEEYASGNAALKDPGDSWPPSGQTWTGGWVESMWHQGSPYNDDCPIDPLTSDRCVVGCVATAMGQIIAFWQYPDSVIFTSADDYTTVSRGIDIDATTASIPSIDYNDGSPSTEVCTDISFACGVSVQMNYRSTGSGAYHHDCANGYRYDFDFSTAEVKDATALDFYDVLEQNMKDSMPAQLGIIRYDPPPPVGHSIVCDGFREPVSGGDDEWHLNYGWGSNNPDPLVSSWYILPSGMPDGFTVVSDGVVNVVAPRRPGPNPEPPVADFSGTPTSGTPPLDVTFSDLSTNTPTTWAWTFGDGGTSDQQNPSHTYSAEGTYTVELIVTNADGSDTETKVDYITVSTTPPPLAAEFTGNPLSGDAPLAVTFTDQSTGSPTSWDWTFGDGGTSTQQTPTYTYNTPGTYTVALTVSDGTNSDTETKTGYITVTDPGGGPNPPVAAFTASPTEAYVPLTHMLTVTFTDQSTNTPTSWVWDFGDGSNTSTEQNPTHIYTSAGDFTVSFTATNADGSDNASDTIHLYVAPSDFFTQAASVASLTQDEIKISYGSPVASDVVLSVYNVNGQLVKHLVAKEIPMGEHSILWNLRDWQGAKVGPGVYFVRLKAPQGHAVTKITITR